MNRDFWLERWREGRIGFHEGRPNDLLVAHARMLGEPGRVLVPLSGKAVDMAWLASLGHEVVGIELSERAVEAFFQEHDLEAATSKRGAMVAHEAGGITLLQGDIFDARPEDVGAITAFYDRAAIVALPPEVRPRYAAHLRTLAGPKATGLVIAFDYPQDQMEGPPFSVGEEELRSYFPSVRCLAERMTEPRASGVAMVERLYHVPAP